jgi:hypothetical protein
VRYCLVIWGFCWFDSNAEKVTYLLVWVIFSSISSYQWFWVGYSAGMLATEVGKFVKVLSLVQDELVLLVWFCLSSRLLSKWVKKFRRRHVNSKAYSAELLSNFNMMWYIGQGYRLPLKEIQEIVDVPPNPSYYISPRRDRIMFLKRRAMPSLSELAKLDKILAGIRIDLSSNTRSRM